MDDNEQLATEHEYMTERARMLAGLPYDAFVPELVDARLRARRLCHALNTLDMATDDNGRRAVVAELLEAPSNAYITPPFFCDYGSNIKLGSNVYFNFNCTILDVCEVSIGDNVLIGPSSS